MGNCPRDSRYTPRRLALRATRQGAFSHNGMAYGWADRIERQNPLGKCIVLGVQERGGNGQYPCEPRRRPDVWHVLAAFVLVDPGARGKPVDSRLDAELLL